MQRERDYQHPTSEPLQDSDALLWAMIENLPGGAAFVVDIDLRYRLAEGEALATAGFKPEDFVGRTIFEVLPPDLAASYEPIYRRGLSGELFEHEHNAHDRFYISRGTPLRSANGEVYGVMVVSYDITDRKRGEDERKRGEDERKQSEVALRESEARLQAVANLVPDLLWDSEPDGSTNWYNQRWLEYTGQTFEQAIGWGWIDAIHPDDREGSARRYREAVEQGMPLQQEHRIRRHDGAYRWFVVKASPLKDERGKVIKMYGAATDIHDRKQTEDALRESEEKYRSLFNSMDEAYAVVEVLSDENGEWNDFLFLEVNPAFVAQTGMEYPVGRKATELLGTPNPEWAKVYGQVAATGAPIRFEEGEATLGRVFDLYVFRLGGDGSRRVAVLFTDITERKRVEDERKRREANLTFLADLMNDFAPLATAEEVMEMVGKRITEHLDLSRYMFVEIFPEAGTCTYLLPSHPPSQLEISGSFVLADYHTEEEHRLLCAGHSMIVNDVRDGTRTPEQIAAFEVFDIASIVNTPYLSNGRWVFDLGVARSKPSVWHEDEIELLRELSAQIWLRIERARTEAELRESEAKYRTLFESMAEGFCSIEVLYNEHGQPVDHRILEANPAFERHTGLTNVRGRLASELMPRVEHFWTDLYARVVTTGKSERLEQYSPAFDRWFDVEVSRIDDASLHRVAVIFQDITERKRAEDALRESETKYRSLFNSIDAGFCIFEMLYNEAGEVIDFRYIETNPAFERQTGRRPQPGQTMRELFPEAEDMWLGDYAEVARTGQAKRFIDFHEELDRWFDVFVFSTSNGTNQLAALFSDITDEKRTEETLRVSEERLAFLLKLSDALRPLADAEAIQRAVARLVGEHFGVANANYARVEVEQGVMFYDVRGSYAAPGRHSFDGRYRPADFPGVTDALHAGHAMVMSEVTADPRLSPEDKASYAAVDVAAIVMVPLVKGGRLTAILGAHDQRPRAWTADEVELLAEVAERTWAAVERARAEAALRQSEAKYRTLFETMGQGYCELQLIRDDSGHNVDHRYLELNPAFERFSGVPAAKARGRRASEIFRDIEPSWHEAYDRISRRGVPERIEHRLGSLDRWFEIHCYPKGDDRLTILYEDITDRKRTEANLALLAEISEDFSSLTSETEIMQSIGVRLANHLRLDGFNFCDVDEVGGTTTVTYVWNAADVPQHTGTYRIADYMTEEFIQTMRRGEIWVVHDTQRDDRVNPETTAEIGLGAYIVIPYHRQGKWRGCFTATDRAARNWTADEIALIQDVTSRTFPRLERSRAEAAMRESELQRVREQAAREQERQRAEALAELDRAKTLFFSNVSHEFRTPLTLSLAPLQDALSDRSHPLDPVHRERLELVHRNSLRLLKLVNTLLDFSRIEAGRMEAVYEPTDLALFTAELASVFRSAIERAGLQLIVDCPPLPEPVFIDREMWEKIVLNLLSNAFKFTFDGEIRVRLHSDSHQAILQIQDTGSGIAPEHLPHLFERFYQVRGTQARTHEGSGIGLALVHELVRLHSGTIEVSSTVGEGTCFTITLTFGTDHLPSDRLHLEGDRILPTRTLASTAMGATAYVEEAERWLPLQTSEVFKTSEVWPSRVLLVDDNADMREYLTRILSEHVQVEAVADGATALRVAQERVPDLILSDIMMPGFDGFELLGALRADPQTREVPIILLSARAGEEAIVEGLEAGADDYLTKPFSAQELVSRVIAHLQMSQLRGEALQEARSTLRSRDEFISVVSHELNTPLVSILGWTRMLRSSPPNPAMLSKALDTIERNATLQGKLVQDLLDLSRISAGKLRLNLQPIELEPVIETAIATVTQTAAEKGIHLTWQENATEPVVVMGDSDRLQQVICNLLTNAIKFTPESGSARVELSIMNNDSTNASYAEIRVIDTGIGIEAEFLPHVFDRFSQAQGANAAKGLGLGLAIANHIVELHHGTIYAESAGSGQGATFTVRLPLLRSRDDRI